MAESQKKMKQRAEDIIELLKKEYPDSKCSLDFKNPLQLLVATMLSAQCTDAQVNKVTPSLFKKYKSSSDFAEAPQEELAEAVRSTGFFNQKAKSIKNCCTSIVEHHGGTVPGTMEELTKLRGVGRKTANVILGNAFDTPGIVVDTHVKRLAGRLGFTKQDNPDKIEQDLNKIIPREEWTLFSHMLVDHGRKYCKARKPDCANCPIAELCPSREL